MVWIEEEMIDKFRLDKGRILVLVPPNKTIPTEVQVKIGKNSFPLSLEVPSIPVSRKWLSSTLGLKSGSNLSTTSEFEAGGFSKESGESEWGLVERSGGPKQFSQNSSEDTSSDGEEPAGRGFLKLKVGECFKSFWPSDPLDHGVLKFGPVELGVNLNNHLGTVLEEGLINNELEEGVSTSLSEVSEQNFSEGG
ncbi:hypothetical protein LWI28_020511 [Acer negundo]|uniref:Uncharacterized protein n=1 Tax=Acer negundo TaxID=4023 RepID=A0AAD5NF53_ACENE|nr:hypothetical protein LWI28_020511 [Acer negundo]